MALLNEPTADFIWHLCLQATLYEKDFKKSFFGSHYNRLEDIKAKYDPNDLFLVAEGVGSEKWDQSLNCRKNY